MNRCPTCGDWVKSIFEHVAGCPVDGMPDALEIDVAPYGEHVDAEMTRTGITLGVFSDWAGDTETGFGQGATHSLNLEQVKTLRDWLTLAIDYLEANPE